MTCVIFRWVNRGGMLGLLLMGGVILPSAGPVRAAGVPVATKSAVDDRDVSALLANDANLADVKRQFAAKEISAAEAKQRTLELTAARNVIVAGYDRGQSRELIARYNAARKTAAAEVAAEKRDAVKQKQAENAAARLAAQETAAREQAEKREAAKGAEVAQAKQLASDAQALTSARLQQEALEFRRQVRPLAPSESAELQGATTTIATITATYSDSGPSKVQHAALEQKAAELLRAQRPAAQVDWIVDAFPDPVRIAAAYPNDSSRAAAAIVVVQRALKAKQPFPFPPKAQAKADSYNQARDVFDPPSAKDHATKSKTYYDLADQPRFQLEVMNKLLAPYAAETEQRVSAMELEARMHAIRVKFNRASNLVIAIELMVPWIILMVIGALSRMRAKAAASPLPLPAEVQVVHVWWKSYPISFDAGIVYDREVWTETYSTTTTSGGSSYVQGGVLVQTPSTTTTRTTSTTYHRYWIRTPSGRETWRVFSEHAFLASIGQIISTVDHATSVLLAYNHATKDFVPLKSSLNKLHLIPGVRLMLAGVATWLVGFWVLHQTMPDGYWLAFDRPHESDFFWAGTIGSSIGMFFYVVAIALFVRWRRNRRFNRVYAPELRQLMEASTPALIAKFRS